MVAEYTALVEPSENRYRAIASAPFSVTVFGATEKEAIESLDREVRERLMRGAKVYRRVVDEEHPLARFAGDMAGDPLTDSWLEAMATYRAEVENDPGYL